MPNILIAEDERPIADLIRMTLKGAGYRCDWILWLDIFCTSNRICL